MQLIYWPVIITIRTVDLGAAVMAGRLLRAHAKA
jgi:hypothetical protein